MIIIEEYQNAYEFHFACRDWLSNREDYYNGILSLADLISAGSQVFPPPYWFGKVMRGGATAGCAIYAEPDGLLLSQIPSSAIVRLVEDLNGRIKDLRRVIGHPKTTRQFAEEWARKSGSVTKLEQKWNIYRVDSTTQNRQPIAGTLRLCCEADRQMIERLAIDYGAETPAPVDVREFMLRKLDDKMLFAWDDHEIRSIATISARTEHGIKISSLYTPPQYRHLGYASAIITALSNHLLSNGIDFVTLSAVDGHRAESIYKRLGYYLIGSRTSYSLKAKE